MTHPLPLYPLLSLADGTTWHIEGGDETGLQFCRLLGKIMQLAPSGKAFTRRLRIKGSIPYGAGRPDLPLICPDTGNSADTLCRVLPINNNIDLADQLMELGLVIASGSEARGGVLLHGALAVNNGLGVIMAGPSDVGKTTASRRLPSPWQSLSDDCALVVRDAAGNFFAHPWPTWSSFLAGDQGQTWPVQKSVPLRAVFLLSQHTEDRVEKVAAAHAAGMIYETSEHCWYGLNSDFPRDTLIKIRTRRFDNICRLAGSIPCFILHLCRDGQFWEKMAQVLDLHSLPDPRI